MKRRVQHLAVATLPASGFMFIPASVTKAAFERPYTYFSIHHPDAVATTLSGINARGDIVGNYVDKDDRKSHGFVLRDGVFTTIDVPGAAGTDARGISPAGDIVGGYRLPDEPPANIHGYLLRRNGVLECIDYPGQTNTIPQRLLPDGTILGCYHGSDTMMSMFGMWMRGTDSGAIEQDGSMNNGATPDLSVIAGLFTDMMEPAPRASWG
jgi:hypothetical protein